MYQTQENGQKPNWGIGSTPGGALSGPVHPWSDLKNYFQHFDQYYLLDIMIACLNKRPKAEKLPIDLILGPFRPLIPNDMPQFFYENKLDRLKWINWILRNVLTWKLNKIDAFSEYLLVFN